MDPAGRNIASTVVTELSGSALRKYMLRAVGSSRYRDLIGYELAATFCRNFPGAAGILLRRLVYRHLLGACGKGSHFFDNVVIRCPKRLFVGAGTVVDHGAFFDIKSDRAKVELGNRCQITNGVLFETGYEGEVRLGDGVYVGAYTILNGHGGLEIGDNSLIGGHCHLVAGNHIFADPDRPIQEQGFLSKGIVIEEDVWLGGGVTVLDGVRVGKGSVVSAGAVVTRSVEPYSVVAGIPARRMRGRV